MFVTVCLCTWERVHGRVNIIECAFDRCAFWTINATKISSEIAVIAWLFHRI